MKIISAGEINEGIREAVKTIKKGGLVIYPTDTLYGLGCNACDESCVKNVFTAKKRPLYNPLSIAVDSIEMLQQYGELTKEAEKLADAFLPGALTIVLQKKNLPDALTGGLQKVGVRIPKNDIALGLIELLGAPITATSANISGNPPPVSAEDAISQIPEADLVLNTGKLPGGIPSTVIDLTGAPKILRQGAIKRPELEKVIGKLE